MKPLPRPLPANAVMLLAALACVLLFGLALRSQAPNAGPSAARPRLVVVIVADQMRADYVERFRSRWHGGLRRLLDRGAWFSNAAYPYAGTETCPGYATVATGVFPAHHGIIGNTWWDRQKSARVTCTEDPSARRVGTTATVRTGDSAAHLLVPSLGDQLRAAVPGSRSVAISVKARSAIMLAGHSADATLWLDESTGELLTSTAYGNELPAFARQFVSANPVAADFSQVWQLSAPRETYTGGRSVAGAGPPGGWTTSFPHSLSAGVPSPGPVFVARWRTSPFADDWLARLAAAAVDQMKLGGGRGVDFLAIGFSATDYIGHSFGPDSLEIEDNMLMLDKTIGMLLEKLDRSVGAGHYVVALTSDHGVAPIPEQARLQGQDAGRLDPSDVVERVEKVLAEQLGPGRHVAQFVAPELYLAPGVAGRIDANPNLWRALRQAVLTLPGVADVVRHTGAPPVSGANALSRALAFDLHPQRSGDIWIGLKRNWIFAAPNLMGTTHGTAYDYDQRVPIILFGGGIKPGRYTASATPADIAPTLTALSGLRIARTDGRILREAFAAPPPVPGR